MKSILLASALFLALSLGIERLVASRAGSFEPRVEKLLELPAGANVAALTLMSPELGGELVYVRAKGLWRSREAFGAICEDARVEALISACKQARGEELTRDPTREARYGLAADARLTVSLHGPKFLERDGRDVLASLEFGHGFGRRSGTPAILALDHDPHAALVRPTPELPPFVDTRVLAGCFGTGFVGFRRIELAYADGRAFALEMQPSTAADATPSWAIVRDGRREDTLVWRPGGYTSLWIRARARGFENPKLAASLGLEHPFLRITLLPSEGEPIEICLSARSPANDALLWNRRTNVLMRIDGELVADMAPEASAFTDAERKNPWERWLMR